MVGRKIVELLTNEFKIENSELYLFESPRKVGKKVRVGNKFYKYLCISRESLEKIKPDFVLFAGGGKVSEEFAPIVANLGGIAIDNSSIFRMSDDVALVVPEVNGNDVKNSRIIANPNCSTIQAVVTLKPLDDAFSIKRIIYSTYQAVSGSGKGGINDYNLTRKGNANEFYPHSIYNNLIPHIDDFLDNGYTKEEKKMIDETRKILGKPNLAVTATTVRVPILNCHSISMNIEFDYLKVNDGKLKNANFLTLDMVTEVLRKAEKDNKGLILMDDPKNNIYPMPMIADNTDAVYIGRIRIDESQPNTINIFCVADNLRKGAATNAVQILRLLCSDK